MSFIAKTPTPPYYAVIFTSMLSSNQNGYQEMADRLDQIAHLQPGFLGMESSRDTEGNGITVSYWESLEAIRDWKQQADHQEAQQKGKLDWYWQYCTRISKVERAYEHVQALTE